MSAGRNQKGGSFVKVSRGQEALWEISYAWHWLQDDIYGRDDIATGRRSSSWSGGSFRQQVRQGATPQGLPHCHPPIRVWAGARNHEPWRDMADRCSYARGCGVASDHGRHYLAGEAPRYPETFVLPRRKVSCLHITHSPPNAKHVCCHSNGFGLSSK